MSNIVWRAILPLRSYLLVFHSDVNIRFVMNFPARKSLYHAGDFLRKELPLKIRSSRSFRLATLAIVSITLFASLQTSYAQDNDDSIVPTAKLVKLNDGDLRVFIGSEFFAEYRADYKGTPIVWPICGPNRSLVTRAWPMIDDVNVEGESDKTMMTIYKNAVISERNGVKDHPHHRSFWFNHGAVNNGDFWGGTPSTIRQIKLVSATEENNTVKIVTENVWRHDKLQRDICRDVRTIVFGVSPDLPNVRFIDFSIEIYALEDNVVFGDTKEGSFGIRVPSPTALTSKKISPNWGGAILDDLGNKDGDTWGKQANWVNYTGPVEKFLEGDELEVEYKKGEKAGNFPLTQMGIAVLNGPNSLGIVPWRHVRDYGLFSSNPFGQKDFEPNNPKANGSRSLNRNESMSFNFRVLFHDGTLTEEELNNAYSNYRNQE